MDLCRLIHLLRSCGHEAPLAIFLYSVGAALSMMLTWRFISLEKFFFLISKRHLNVLELEGVVHRGLNRQARCSTQVGPPE